MKYFNKPPYSAAAPVYNQMMDHVDYDMWADYISSLFQQFGSSIQNVIDGGCGTAILINKFKTLGYTVAGFDKSLEMLKQADKKNEIPLWQGDLRELSMNKNWDAFLCLYDTIQYLNIDEIRHLMQELENHLFCEGLFIFDIATKKNIREYWSGYTEKNIINGFDVIRTSRYKKKHSILFTDIQIFSQSSHEYFWEHHIQHILSLKKYKELISKTTWNLIGCFHEFTLKPADENSYRVHFVLKKEGKSD